MSVGPVATILERLGAGDRALFARWVLGQSATRRVKITWETLTHLGSVWCTIAVCLIPLLTDALSIAGRLPFEMLVVSHLVIQALKRTIGRARPTSWHVGAALVDAPDRFSFPSGHAASAMSVALGFAHAFPDLAALLVMLAVLVGLSRVVVGVHYPSDVLGGQLIAVVTGLAIMRIA